MPKPLRTEGQGEELLVTMTAEAIDQDITVLLLIHPRDIMESAEYALDQFVLRGGKLIAFVDPYMFFDQQPNPMMPNMKAPTKMRWSHGITGDLVDTAGGGPDDAPDAAPLA